jgi:hypothetical protein
VTTDKTRKFSRRALLNGLGLGLGMLPVLSFEKTPAQAADVAKRFISITWTNGVVAQNFFPPAGPLTGTLPPILTPLDKWKSKILAMRGPGAGTTTGGIDAQVMIDLGVVFGGHQSYPALLTGSFMGPNAAVTPSIDTLIADQLKAQGLAMPQLNVGCRPGPSTTSWRANGVKNHDETDPYTLFTRLFGASAPPPVDKSAIRRKSVMDFCIDDLTRFAAPLGLEDRVKIDGHLDAIRSLEKQLVAAPSCVAPANTPAGLDFKLNANYPTQVKMMIDIIAAVVKCDIARAITLDLIDDGGGNSLAFPWLPVPMSDYHALSHTPDPGPRTTINTWFYSQVADLVGQLAANPEGASTSLDNSVVLVCNDMNEGTDSRVSSLPYLIIGSGGGFFKQGTCVQFPANVPNNRLLTSICHAMDLPVASVGTTYAGDLDATLKA